MLSEMLMKNENFIIGKWAIAAPIQNRTVWDSLPSFDKWLEAGNIVAHKKIAKLPLSLWLTFAKQGNRAKYESPYFQRRSNLVKLVMAECMANSGNYIPIIADYIWAICEESAWQLPAHNNYERDAPTFPLPNTSKPVIDLFSAETGALLATVKYLLAKPLNEYAPQITTRISKEIETRLLTPWRKTHFWWMGNEKDPMCNWTPWCTQNLLICTAILYPKNSTKIRNAVKQAAYSLDCFLKDYGTDGCCSEGAQYYSHAGLALYQALEILCTLAPGVFDTVWQQEKIKNIANYILNVHVSGEYYLNFADCSPKAGYRGAQEYLFAKRVNSPTLQAFAAQDFIANPDPFHLQATDPSECSNLYCAIQTAFTQQEIITFVEKECSHKNSQSKPAPSDIWYASNGLNILHRGIYTAGIKAGNNADSHNHNDVGSVTLYKDGEPFLIDIGVETYTKKTFSPKRYEIWTMQSAWHNLPTFIDENGQEYQQIAGEQYAASQVNLLQNGLQMNLALAYGNVPKLSFYKRTAILTANGLTLQDETDYPYTVMLSLLSVAKPKFQKNHIQLTSLGTITMLSPTKKVDIEPITIKDNRLLLAWPSTLYRTKIMFQNILHLQIN